MSKKLTTNELQKILLETRNGVVELLKTVTHSKRMQVLVLLLNKPKKFSMLRNETKLSKTALANHLTQLLEKGLIEKIERGNYRITRDGEELLEAAANVYIESSAKKARQRAQLRERYSQGYKAVDELKLNEKIVSNQPEYQHCWISYLGAVSGVLKSLGNDYDITDVGGYSGYSFFVNVAKGTTCPSGPTAHQNWKEIIKGTENLGWKLHSFDDNKSFPNSDGLLTEEDQKRASNLFNKIKAEIDKNDRPVVLWGVPVPEYGIVKGYQGDSYVVSTFRSAIGQPDLPIKYDSLQAPGCLHAIFFTGKTSEISEQNDKYALKQAIKMAEGTTGVREGYIAGPAAYDEWATVLEKASAEDVPYHGNSYVGACTCETKELEATFLERLATKYSDQPQATSLSLAAQEYRKAEALMKQFVELFPFAMTGELSGEKRKKGAELLRKVKPLELSALSHLKTAYEQWS